MLFNSMSFMIFLPIVFALYWVCPPKHRWALLLIASYYFYMSWNIKYVVLILFTTVISYACGLFLSKSCNIKYRKIYLATTLVMSLGVLFIFKYLEFFFDSIQVILSQFSIPLNTVTFNLLLPVGISFYTFQTLSYVIDVYRGDTEVETHFGKYATFVSFFPQLVAGPIERSKNLLTQINKLHKFDYDKAIYGVKLIAWGFFQKVVIADTVAEKVNLVYDNLLEYQGFSIVIACFLFSIQIYCDFAGYSNIAIGVAKLFGMDLMINFKSPYFSTSVHEFWNRWHISLSTWFKDYVYIPLGGNRKGNIRSKMNLLITFLVSGLWHGASYTFILWGGVHGLLQIVEKLFPNKEKGKLHRLLWLFQCGCMFVLITITWIFFRAQSIDEVIYIFINALSGITNPVTYLIEGMSSLFSFVELIQIVIPCMTLIVFDYFNSGGDTIELIGEKPIYVRWMLYVIFAMIFFLFFPSNTSSEFVYFQF